MDGLRWACMQASTRSHGIAGCGRGLKQMDENGVLFTGERHSPIRLDETLSFYAICLAAGHKGGKRAFVLRMMHVIGQEQCCFGWPPVTTTTTKQQPMKVATTAFVCAFFAYCTRVFLLWRELGESGSHDCKETQCRRRPREQCCSPLRLIIIISF